MKTPALSTLLIVFLLCSVGNAQENVTPTISVSGTGEIRVLPDQAVLRFSIESRSTKLSEAVVDNDAKVSSVTQYLNNIKVEPRFIRTDMIGIRPLFDNSQKAVKQQTTTTGIPTPAGQTLEQKIMPIGYSARRDISVTINDLKQFETIYRGLLERGVNEVNNISFLSSELQKHREEARLMAVRAANQKATMMAEALDCQLAAVRSIRENGPSYRGANLMSNSLAIEAGNVSGSIASGMITISASVDIVFVLNDVEMNE